MNKTKEFRKGCEEVKSTWKRTAFLYKFIREDYALDILKHFGFDKYSSNLHGADNGNILKKSDIIELCISNSLVKDKSKITYIGDTPSDLNAAKETNVSFIGVNFPFAVKH